MLKELLDSIVQLGRESQNVQTVKEFRDGTTRYRKPDGSLVEMQSPPDPRAHKALDLSAIVEFALENVGDSVIWYNRSAVVCLINDETRRDRVTLEMAYSPQMRLLMQLEQNPKQFTQSELVLILRTTFNGCYQDEISKSLLPAVRAVTFTKNSEGESTVDHGKASIGKKLTEKVTGAVAIPEYVTLKVPVFANAFDFTRQIRCAVEIDVSKERFQLIPLPLEIEKAISASEASIAEDIAELIGEVETPIRYGSP